MFLVKNVQQDHPNRVEQEEEDEEEEEKGDQLILSLVGIVTEAMSSLCQFTVSYRRRTIHPW